jgi:HEAT repeat protein
LARIGRAAKSAEPEIEEVLAEREQSTRIRAALTLATIDPQNERCRVVLLESLGASDRPTLLALGQLGSDARWAEPALTKLLVHPERGVRALAAQTLGQIGPTANHAQSALTQALRDGDPIVREAAQRALDKIQQKPPGT